MPESIVRIVVDPSGAVAGEKVVSKSFDDIRARIKTAQSDLQALKGSFTTYGQTAASETRKARTSIDQDHVRIREAFKKTDQTVKTSEFNFKGFARSLVGALGVTGGLIAVVREMQATVDVGSRFTKTISQLSAITGASGEDLRQLSRAARDMARDTTVGAVAAAEGFKLIASAKPDLLQNRDALIAVTKEAVTLSEAAGIELPEAAKALGGALNQFKADADQAGRFINVLAAGSKLGATEIPDLTESLRASGTAASALGLSFETTIAGIETLGEVNIKGADAGTQFRNVLLALKQTGIDVLDPSVHGLAGSLENLNQLQLKQTDILKIFGRESFVAATALIKRTQRIRDLEDGITGTTIAEEQAGIATDNLSSDYDRLGNAVDNFRIALFEGGEPALRSFIQTAVTVINTLSDLSTALGEIFGEEQRTRSELSAASLEFIDQRLAEEEKVLARIQEANEGISGTISAFINDTTFGFLNNTNADLLAEQQTVVDTIRKIREERSKLEQDTDKNETAAAAKTGTIDPSKVASIRAKLSGDKKGKSGLSDEERAAKRAADEQARSFASLRAQLEPLAQAEDDVTKAQGVLNEQFRLGKIDANELQTLHERLAEAFKDSLDPLAAMKRGFDDERSALALSSEERAIELDLRKRVQSLQAQGVTLTAAEIEGLRSELVSLQQMNEQTQVQEALLKEIKGPQKDMIDQVAALNTLFEQGDISIAQYNEKLDDLRLSSLEASTTVADGFERGFIKAQDSMNDFAAASEQVITGTFKGMEDGIVNFATTGKAEFSGLADQILSDIVRIEARQALSSFFGAPGKGDEKGSGLFGFLSGGGGGEGGGGGGFASLAGSLGNLFASNADGGIETSPVISKLAEKGPEAIIPLKGGAVPVQIQDSKRPPTVIQNTFHISTPDVAGFKRSQGAIGLEVGRSIQRDMARNG